MLVTPTLGSAQIKEKRSRSKQRANNFAMEQRDEAFVGDGEQKALAGETNNMLQMRPTRTFEAYKKQTFDEKCFRHRGYGHSL
jgi:hypothetical protein